MTTSQTSTVFSLFGAAITTIAMLAGVKGLATSDAHNAQMAHAAPSQPKA